jgi:mutator protein MutT
MQKIHRSVGAVLLQAGQILLARRAPHRALYPDVWDVLGGHIESDETPEHALIRELKEEVGIEPVQWSYLETVTAITESDVFECLIYAVTDWRGVPANRQPEEHSIVEWFSLEAATLLKLAHPSYPSIFGRAING